MQSSAAKDDTAKKHEQFCSFCGKSSSEVRKLVAGTTVFICDECIDLCAGIVKEELPPPATTLLGIQLLSMQESMVPPEELVLLKKAVEDGDIPFVIRYFKTKFEAATASLEDFAAVEPEHRREAGVKALAMHLFLLIQCAGFLGIEPEEISAEIDGLANNELYEAV